MGSLTCSSLGAMPIPREQLRLRPDDREILLKESRVAHTATVGEDGAPHVVPLWFVWDGSSLWVNSLKRSRRAKDLAAGSRVSVCIDAGIEYGELRGVTFDGHFELVEDESALDPIRAAFGIKYWHGVDVPEMKSHSWLRLEIDSEASWDFRRIQEVGRDRRLSALKGEDS